MPASRIPPQDPSMSPTFAMSTNQTQATMPASIRRNLFAAHLSRRPVAPPSQNSFDSSISHQDVQSQPDLYTGPTLQPTKRSMAFPDVSNPELSPPSHPTSPLMTSSMFSRESIIAVHPVTGRPLLPVLPTLPPRLRLSEEDDEDDDSDMEMGQEPQLRYGGGQQQHGFPHSPTYHNNLNLSSDLGFDTDIDSSELERLEMQAHTVHSRLGFDHGIDTNSEESHRDRERIERLLADMMARQRARARTIATVAPPHDSNMAATSSNATTNTGRARKTATAKIRDRRNLDYHPPSSPPKYNSTSSADLAVGGVGATMDPHEKDELMGLIMTSLRRKLQTAEDEGWMYGGADGLGGIGGSGLESDAVGIWD